MNAKTIFNLILIIAVGAVGGMIFRQAKQREIWAGRAVLVQDDIDLSTAAHVSEEEIENPDPVIPSSEQVWISEFQLTERNGQEVTHQDLLGEPYVVSFFFTTCPSVCVTQNQTIAKLQKQYRGQPIRFLSITVDPEMDTPEVMTEYAARFGADADQWLFLTGGLDEIRVLGTEVFQQPLMKQFHTERFGLVDSKGQVVGIYTWSSRIQLKKLKSKIDELLAASPENKNSASELSKGERSDSPEVSK